MKKVLYSLLVLLALSCTKEHSIEEIHNESVLSSVDSQNSKSYFLSNLMIPLATNLDVVNEVFNATQASINQGLDEVYYFAEILDNANCKIYNPVLTKADSKSLLGNLLKNQLLKRSLQTKYNLNDILNSDMQIYWPYSENWDKESIPWVSKLNIPDNVDKQDLNIDSLWVYQEKTLTNGEIVIDSLYIGESFAVENPVWIVNEAEIRYRELPNISIGERVAPDGTVYATIIPSEVDVPKDVLEAAPTKWQEVNPRNPIIIPDTQKKIYSVYLGKFMASETHECWVFGGGPEFVVQMGSIEDFNITNPSQLLSLSPSVNYTKICLTRKNVKNRQWFDVEIRALMASNWSKNQKEAAFMIYEEDFGGERSFNFEIGVDISGKSYGFNIDLKYHKWDDMIAKRLYDRDFIFSSNNYNDGSWSIDRSAGVNWALEYEIGTTND